MLFHRPEVGAYIELDSGARGALQPCNDWNQAEFRFPVTALCVKHAVNVNVTGRTIQRQNNGRWVRIAMVFVGDGDPDVKVGGKLFVN